ncbi:MULTISPECIES: ferrous iron transport protein A [unclassified Clostridium]|jgi:ferrous iron transport protein A|uniref:FeoA family protein n=1 Tax=Clostridia TaxID=186801 RepID=UPI000821F8FF|nr:MULTISPECIES: ferrous iron transport protein A [unclassified Clostridium]SCJ75299.1 Ferrous iron transport protein A [uncultured Clostridium sp.]
MQTLKEAKVGQTVQVVKLYGEGAVKRRIMDMGITKGVEVYVRKVAPLGDPVEVNVRGYELSIRKADAEKIEVRAKA